jgi:hypothetical protein
MTFRGLAQPRLGIDRLQAHGPQQPADACVFNRIALVTQPRRHPANPITWGGGTLLIEQPHQLQVLHTFARRLIVQVPPGQP